MSSDKKEIRKRIIEIRDSMENETRKVKDEAIFNTLVNSDYYREAKTIFVFVNFGSEVDTGRIIEHALMDGKIICVPRVKSKADGMSAYQIKGMDDLVQGYYGIMEPSDRCALVNASEIDFVVVPGVAFDNKGGRIGYGGGFYDRYLSGIEERVPKIAVAYDLQIIDHVPTSEHDIIIDGIITEKQFIVFSR